MATERIQIENELRQRPATPDAVEAAINYLSGNKGGVAGIYNRASYLPERTRAMPAPGMPVSRTMLAAAARNSSIVAGVGAGGGASGALRHAAAAARARSRATRNRNMRENIPLDA